MRMFLVAMCDLFLILYLTVIVQHGGQKPSKITLADYKNLERSEEELSLQLAELNAQLLNISAERDRLASSNLESSEMVAQLKLERAEQDELLEVLNAEKARLDEQVTELATKAETAEKSRLDVFDKQQAIQTELSLAQSRQETLALDLEKRTNDLALAREQLTSAQLATERLAEKSEAEKKAALDAAQEAAAQAALAEEQARLLSEQLDRARQRTHEVALQAEKAEAERTAAESLAATAENQAAAARERAEKVSSRLESITQDSRQAFETEVAPKLALISATVQTDGVFGVSTKKYQARGIVSIFKGESVVFQHREELGVSKNEGYSSVEFNVNNLPVRNVLISQSSSLIGLIVPGGRTEQANTTVLQLMPTLLVVRNDAKLGLVNRIRDVAADYFAVKRDNFTPHDTARLNYAVRGLRGTGDFAEVILPGDQIVDLSGMLVGVSDKENSLLLPSRIDDWQMMSLVQAFN